MFALSSKRFAVIILSVTAIGSLGYLGPMAQRLKKKRPSVIVRLDQQEVPVEIDGQIVAHKTAYFGTVHVGYPHAQSFSVVYDTGSAHFFVPSISCPDEACLVHKRFNRSLSSTVVDLDHDGMVAEGVGNGDGDRVAIEYGTGEVVGDFVRDVVCLGTPPDGDMKVDAQPHCVQGRVITATELTTEPFKEFAFDGVFGLGLEALALHPEFNLFHVMSQNRNMESVFGFFLSTTAGVHSEIAFGGPDLQKVSEPLRWVPVHDADLGYWQVKVHGFRLGDEKFDDICAGGACQAIVDTGTSLLGVPHDISDLVHLLLVRRVPDLMQNVNCREYPGPSIVFDMGGFEIEVGPAEHAQTVPIVLSEETGDHPPNATVCRSTLFPIEMPMLGKHVFIFGEPILRKYYTAYDMKAKRVGFALAAQPKVTDTEMDLVI